MVHKKNLTLAVIAVLSLIASAHAQSERPHQSTYIKHAQNTAQAKNNNTPTATPTTPTTENTEEATVEVEEPTNTEVPAPVVEQEVYPHNQNNTVND